MAGNGKDTVKGGHRIDYIFGENGDDQLWGERGEDIISGGNGDDDIRGGRSSDQIIGGRDDGTFLVITTQEEGDDLVENGSFEEPFADLNADNIEENSPGSSLWYLIDDQQEPDQVLGWDNDDGGAIELQFDETGGVIELDGDVKLELDSGPAFGFTDDETTPLVAQDLSTIADETYTLTFGAYERADGLSDFQVEWDGQEIDFTYVDGDGPESMVSSTAVIPGVVITVDYLDDDGDLTGWNIVTVTGLEASSDTTTIGFEKPGTSVAGEHRGPLIDAVSFEAEEDAAAFTLTAGDELWGGDETNLEDGQADTFYYDFGRGDGVDLIYGFELLFDEINIANLDGYTPVIIEDDGGDIIAFLETGEDSIPANFQEDAAIQLVGVDTGVETFDSAIGQGWLIT